MLFCIYSFQISLGDAHELQSFNQLLIAPIDRVFGSHNSLDNTVHFYKSLFEMGWSLLVCLDSDVACKYLQVLHYFVFLFVL